MKEYFVSSTWDADADTLRHYLYIRNVLMNPQAADAYLTDYDETRELLSKSAGSLRVGEHPLMKERELRRINFIRHDYFLVYHIEGDEAERLIAADNEYESTRNPRLQTGISLFRGIPHFERGQAPSEITDAHACGK